MEAVLTTKELAQRWKCDPSSIYLMREKGELKTIPKVPGVKFSLAYIEEIESEGLDPLSPRQKRILERQLAEKEAYIKKLEEKIQTIKQLLV